MYSWRKLQIFRTNTLVGRLRPSMEIDLASGRIQMRLGRDLDIAQTLAISKSRTHSKSSGVEEAHSVSTDRGRAT